MPTISQALHAATALLAAAGLDPDGAAPPRREAELLLCAATDLTRSTLIGWPERALTAAQAARFEAWIERRAAGEPIAYILGRWEFHGLELALSPAALIPRPETELLVDWALASLPEDKPLICADLGTGSGAIAAALAHERPGWTVVAVEHSAEALRIAAANARALELGNLLPVRGDWLAAIANDRLDALVSNPPYVCGDDPHLSRGDLRFEPRAALAAGPDGLDAIRSIIGEAHRCLRPGGHLALEHGWNQDDAVRALLAAAGYDGIGTQHDLGGLPRLTWARRPDRADLEQAEQHAPGRDRRSGGRARKRMSAPRSSRCAVASSPPGPGNDEHGLL